MKIRAVESPQEEAQGMKRWAFFCPGCKCGHQICTGTGQWTFDGDMEKPTINPSVLCYEIPEAKIPRCHSFVRAGVIQFLSDCSHELAGKTVPLEDF